MTAARPRVVAGTLPCAGLFAQFWGEAKVVGEVRPVEYATINQTLAGVSMLVRAGLPAEWMPEVWAAYEGLVRGELPTVTHEITWPFGSSFPTFTEAA